MGVKNRFSVSDRQRMVDAISRVEKCTSAELRIHFEARCKGDVMDRASHIFARLGMHKTALRNGVLVYIALDDRKMAVIGDKGVNAHLHDSFWDALYGSMRQDFAEKGVVEGVCRAVVQIGEALTESFPYCADDVDELPNEISFNDNHEEK